MKGKIFSYSVLILVVIILGTVSCREDSRVADFTGEPNEVRLINLNPGHFHAYLVQKDMYPQVDPLVYVYAPDGPEIEQYISMINNYNGRSDNPTSWALEVYRGDDYLEVMLEEMKGNVVVMAGNNKQKTAYIKKSVDAGLHMLADKPMAIDAENFELLKEAFETARKRGVLLYDIMTERYEITSILQKELMHIPGIFGELDKGAPGDPSIIKESVHHFFKYVSGQILSRPPWFFDVMQQGEGIVDVTTHLVDLVQWSAFPGQIIDYHRDIEMVSARRWPTEVTLDQFSSITGLLGFPDYLREHVDNDTLLNVYANGEIDYTINDVHARVIVKWNYSAPEGAGDTHYSLARGTNASLVIRQGEEQNYKPVLYIEPSDPGNIDAFEEVLLREFPAITSRYPGVELKKLENSWEVIVPEVYDVGHEAHFAQVTEKFLGYLIDGKLPDWEVPNMITKYYITTTALEMAKAGNY